MAGLTELQWNTAYDHLESEMADALDSIKILRKQVAELQQQLLDVTDVASAMNYVNKREYSFPLAQ